MKLHLNIKNNHYLVFTIFVLFSLPVLLVLSNIFYPEIANFFQGWLDNRQIGIDLVFYFQSTVLVIMLLIYPMYPAIFPTQEYFKKIGNCNAVFEYKILKRIVYVLSPFFVYGLIFLITQRIFLQNPMLEIMNFLPSSFVFYFFLIIIVPSFFIVGSALIKILYLISRRQFRYYFAKAYFSMLLKGEDHVEKTRYLVEALNSYNKYLRRNLGLQINDLKRIYSKFLSDPSLNKNIAIEELSSAIKNSDKLRLITSLSNLLKIQDTDLFLVREPLRKRLQDWATLIGTVASALAAIVGAIATTILRPSS